MSIPQPEFPTHTATVVAVSFLSYLIFHKYEPLAILPLSCLLLLVPAAISGCSMTSSHGVLSIPAIFVAYWSLLLFFTAVYRISPFHPLAKYPGPFLNKLSKLRLASVTASGYQHHHYYELHQKYGDIVRIGPNELSYCNVDGVTAVLGMTGLTKGPFYDHRGPVPSLLNARDPAVYTPLRHIWNRAMNGSAVKGYQDILARSSRQLVDSLNQQQHEVVDISKWMEFFSFDFMADFSFGYPFDLMKMGADNLHHIDSIMGIVRASNILGHIPWGQKYLLMPLYPNELRSIFAMSDKLLKARMESGSTKKDLFYYLGNEDGKQTESLTGLQLLAEGVNAIIAGSDTTSIVLVNLWYFLLCHPPQYARLRAEIDAHFAVDEDPLDQHRLAEMPFLYACINECLRLLPPSPSGSQRSVLPGSGGKMVGSHFIPENTNITIHTYTVQRDPRHFFPYPNTFWPDRWLEPSARRSLQDPSQPFSASMEVVHDTTAFIPFSIGPRACVGKTLAMNEMRAIVACVVQRFDMKVAPGYDLDRWEKELEDYFLLKKGVLPVVVTGRVY